jgi:hypothetical protein
MQPLFARSCPEIELVASGPSAAGASTNLAAFGAHLPAGSLPRLFRGNEASFAAAPSPYLLADRALQGEFRSRYFDGRRLVGLAWHTKNARTGRRRSVDLATLAPLFSQRGVRFVSLQYGDFDALEEQAATAGAPH